jgi:hypothetical protein
MGLDITIQILDQRQLPASKTTLYTVPTATSVIVRSISLVNTSGSGVPVVLYFTKAGGSSRRVISLTMAAGDAVFDDTAYCLGAGDLIEGEAGNGTSIDSTITGVVNKIPL